MENNLFFYIQIKVTVVNLSEYECFAENISKDILKIYALLLNIYFFINHRFYLKYLASVNLFLSLIEHIT